MALQHVEFAVLDKKQYAFKSIVVSPDDTSLYRLFNYPRWCEGQGSRSLLHRPPTPPGDKKAASCAQG